MLLAAEAHAEACWHFERWIQSADEFSQLSGFTMGDGMGNKAAFLLHQASEHLCHCVLLVLTLCSPKSHRLSFLRSQAEQTAPELGEVWPRSNRFERRSFQLLRQTYLNARYSSHYVVSAAELRWLTDRVGALRDLVVLACRRRLDEREDWESR